MVKDCLAESLGPKIIRTLLFCVLSGQDVEYKGEIKLRHFRKSVVSLYNNCLYSTTCIENLKCKQIRALRSVPPFYTVFMKKERKGEGAYKNVKKGWPQHQSKPLLFESHDYFYTEIRDRWDMILCCLINRWQIFGRTRYFSKLKEGKGSCPPFKIYIINYMMSYSIRL